MARPRKKPLPRGVHERRHASGRATYWIDFRDQTGTRRQEPGGSTIDDAVRLLADRRRAISEGTYQPGAGTGGQTLATYARTFAELRRAEGVRSADREEQLLRDHVLPTLGALRLDELRPRHVAAWVRAVEGQSPKSILNAHGALSALLARARFEELIPDNPAKGLPRGVLPKNVRVREVGAWTRDELEILITHEAIPEDRRIAYAISAFTGARLGEVAGLRWSDLDVKATPLWRWALRTQYDRQPLKTDNPRDVPIHPELRALLAAWKLEGWPRMMCRHPRPDDLVVPRETPVRLEREGGVVLSWLHSKESLGAKAVHRHAKLAGISSAGRDAHSFRRAMITCARVDGVREDMLEPITHNASGTMIDAYTYFGWADVCAELGKLRIAVRRNAAVIRLAPSANGDARGDAQENAPEILNDLGGSGMEAPGVEPWSGIDRPRISAVPGGRGRSGRTADRTSDPAIPSVIPGPVTRVTAGSRLSQLELEERGARAAELLAGIGEVLLGDAVTELLARERERH